MGEEGDRLSDRLDRAFFCQPTLQLARALLGAELVHVSADGVTAGILVEVEAYMGPDDLAAHARKGLRSRRTEVMYGPPGYAYVFQVYGMHFCLNVVSGPPETPHAILLRAIEPTEGLSLMARRRGVALPPRDAPRFQRQKALLASGPARLAQAMGVDRTQYGWDLVDSPLYLCRGRSPVAESELAAGPRINIDYAGDWRDKPWRFWIRGNPHVSARSRSS